MKQMILRGAALLSVLCLFALGFSAFSFSAQAQTARYGVKSGILKIVAEADGHETPETQYFDDYGAVESITFVMDIPGFITYDVWYVTRGSKLWAITVTDGKRAVKEADNPTPDLNFLSPSPEVVAKYNLQEVGEEIFLDRPCKIFTYEMRQGRKKNMVKSWVYKGIILRSEMTVGRRTSTTTAVEFKENVTPPAGVFNTEE